MKFNYIIVVAFISIGGLFLTASFKNSSNNSTLDSKVSYKPIVVLELFTSQGCSSCPSADLLLQKVKNEYAEEVFALSYHVDYWNYIGWKDPFSSSSFAVKQRIYNEKFRNRSNCTPQLVINGKEHFVGSNSAKMYGGINKYKNEKTSNELVISEVDHLSNEVLFNYEVKGDYSRKEIRVLLAIDFRTTQVKRGENRNRTLNNSNIVVSEKSFLLENSNGAMEIKIPKIVSSEDKLNLIVIIETTDNEITAAAKYGLLQ